MQRGCVGQMREAIREADEQHDGGQREAEPRGQRAAESAAQPADRDADLAAARPRQELAQRDDVAERVFVEPAAPLDEFVAEIAQVRGRTAERGESETQKDEEERPRRGARRRGGGRLGVCKVHSN
jgi:hypothetical protein